MTGSSPDSYQAFFRGRTATLMGLGLLGRGVGDAAFLAQHCERVLVTDLKSEDQLATSIDALKQFGNIEFFLGAHPDQIFADTDFVIKAAGVPLQNPQIALARTQGVPIYMSTALFAFLSGAKIVGVTGTRGKSTTTQMIFESLVACGQKALLGGNVRGVSTLAQLPIVTAGDFAVLELDSWQLQGFDDLSLSPHVSVFTSFYPDHMNYYKGDMERYFYDKCSIFRHQTAEDVFVAPAEIMDLIEAGEIRSRRVVAEQLPESMNLHVLGDHNRLNATLALAAGAALDLDTNQLIRSLETYKALEGRLQHVRDWRNIAFYNDSNATTQEATLAALKTLGANNTVLIWGGADKGLPIDKIAEFVRVQNVRSVALAGTGTERLKPIFPAMPVCNSMREAVSAAIEISRAGDKIVLSPGFASFGGFENEYDRSDQFLASVSSLS